MLTVWEIREQKWLRKRLDSQKRKQKSKTGQMSSSTNKMEKRHSKEGEEKLI